MQNPDLALIVRFFQKLIQGNATIAASPWPIAI
jgi:hypothetical protein